MSTISLSPKRFTTICSTLRAWLHSRCTVQPANIYMYFGYYQTLAFVDLSIHTTVIIPMFNSNTNQQTRKQNCKLFLSVQIFRAVVSIECKKTHCPQLLCSFEIVRFLFMCNLYRTFWEYIILLQDTSNTSSIEK
jgi:hypothetical protein